MNGPMSKITFRADDDLVEELETFDTSKSEVMRQALREYLEASDTTGSESDPAGRSDAGGRAPPSSRAPASGDDASAPSDESLDGLVATRLDELIERRVDAALEERLGARPADTQPSDRHQRDVNVQITLEEPRASDAGKQRSPSADSHVRQDAADERKTRSAASEDTHAHGGPEQHRGDPTPEGDANRTCTKCGETVDQDHVYCPNCGGKASRRLFCECGDELRSDWAFCPGCGRRTAAADVLDSA